MTEIKIVDETTTYGENPAGLRPYSSGEIIQALVEEYESGKRSDLDIFAFYVGLPNWQVNAIVSREALHFMRWIREGIKAAEKETEGPP